MHSYRSLSLCIATAALACGSGAAFADDDPVAAELPSIADPATPQSQPGTTTGPAAAQVDPLAASNSIFADGRPVDVERLAAMRGGDDTNESNASVDGSVHGNVADRVVSGSNFISDDTFSSASGLNTVIQNSGSNVLIQNGMSIQVIFANPGQ